MFQECSMTTNLSLREFCRQHDLAPATVHRIAKQMGISLSDGVDEVASDRLLTYFGISPAPKTEEEGGAIAVPGMQSIDLEHWGVVETQIHIDDPLALARSAIEAMDTVESALNAHVSQLEARRDATLTAAQQIQQRRQKLEASAIKTELRTEFLGTQIAAGERQLRQDVDALGKSSAA
jgi:hypothetical protein